MNNDDKKINKAEYFELREKRLKLVYKILYVVVAIWIATILGISGTDLVENIAPVYVFLLSSSSLFIIQIVKYALMEFQCMKVIGNIDDSVLMQTEKRYDNIWKSFSLTLSLNALIMIIHIKFPIVFSPNVLMWIFIGCIVYFLAFSIAEMFTKMSDKAIKCLDIINLLVGILTAYSICAFCCAVTMK